MTRGRTSTSRHPLAVLRRARGLSQAEVARRAGVAKCTVCRIELGKGGSMPSFRAIARALRVRVAEIVR